MLKITEDRNDRCPDWDHSRLNACLQGDHPRYKIKMAAASASGRSADSGMGGLSMKPIILVGIVTIAAVPLMLLYGLGAEHVGAGAIGPLVCLTVFAAAAVSSIAGFAFSALCGAVLFHTKLEPVLVVQTMLISSIGIQIIMLLSMWRNIAWFTVLRFLIGGMVGLPLGLLILFHVNRRQFCLVMGALLCGYTLYMMLRRPAALPASIARLDPLIGVLGGLTGGIAAFPGAPVTVWCQLKGWTRDAQRGVYQPFILIMQVTSLLLMHLLYAGKSVAPLVWASALTVPPAIIGSLIGLYVFRQCSERAFLLVMNAMLLVSGLTLLI